MIETSSVFRVASNRGVKWGVPRSDPINNCTLEAFGVIRACASRTLLNLQGFLSTQMLRYIKDSPSQQLAGPPPLTSSSFYPPGQAPCVLEFYISVFLLFLLGDEIGIKGQLIEGIM
jgi:hypothetical protein